MKVVNTWRIRNMLWMTILLDVFAVVSLGLLTANSRGDQLSRTRTLQWIMRQIQNQTWTTYKFLSQSKFTCYTLICWSAQNLDRCAVAFTQSTWWEHRRQPDETLGHVVTRWTSMIGAIFYGAVLWKECCIVATEPIRCMAAQAKMQCPVMMVMIWLTAVNT